MVGNEPCSQSSRVGPIFRVVFGSLEQTFANSLCLLLRTENYRVTRELGTYLKVSGYVGLTAETSPGCGRRGSGPLAHLHRTPMLQAFTGFEHHNQEPSRPE
jgi:hypothetical protein